MLTITFAILIIGGINLYYFRSDRKVDFTYKIYGDFIEFLKDNPDLKKWLFGHLEIKNVDDYINRIGDLLEKFEIIWGLKNKNTIDEDIMYTAISYYVEKAFQYGAMDYINEIRDAEKDNISYSNDLFAGTEKLYKWVVDINSKREASAIVDA